MLFRVSSRVLQVEKKNRAPQWYTLANNLLGQCKARPFNFDGVCLFFVFFYFSASTDNTFSSLTAENVYYSYTGTARYNLSGNQPPRNMRGISMAHL